MKSLNSYTESITTALYNELGAFFAFGTSQLNEAIEKNKANGFSGEKSDYCSLFSGLIAPKSNADELLSRMDAIHTKGIEQRKAEYTDSQLIQYELGNHEAQITGCIDDTVDALEGYGFSREQVQREYKVFYKHCVKNDLF